MIRLFDFHTHILPGIDDGSKSVEESLAMIQELAAQGAYGIAATPHFYASRMSPESFFANRALAWEKLKPYVTKSDLEIRLGAEIQYFEGIHLMQDLQRFCIEGTQLLLIEMPFCRWTDRMVSTVLEINAQMEFIVLLAHIERYLPYHNQKALKILRENGVLMQANTGFFVNQTWTAMRMLKKGQIHLRGTDAHNMGNRSPDLRKALEIICRKNGVPQMEKIHNYERTIFSCEVLM